MATQIKTAIRNLGISAEHIIFTLSAHWDFEVSFWSIQSSPLSDSVVGYFESTPWCCIGSMRLAAEGRKSGSDDLD